MSLKLQRKEQSTSSERTCKKPSNAQKPMKLLQYSQHAWELQNFDMASNNRLRIAPNLLDHIDRNRICEILEDPHARTVRREYANEFREVTSYDEKVEATAILKQECVTVFEDLTEQLVRLRTLTLTLHT